MIKRVLLWVGCHIGLCSLIPSYDDGGVYWQCTTCGKVSR
jgi:hypothetical protein